VLELVIGHDVCNKIYNRISGLSRSKKGSNKSSHIIVPVKRGKSKKLSTGWVCWG
jgi:hypothetical protein